MTGNHIWAQHHRHLRACVTVVNNLYRYEVYDHSYHPPHQWGWLLVDGYAPTFPAAKWFVFAWLAAYSALSPP